MWRFCGRSSEGEESDRLPMSAASGLNSPTVYSLPLRITGLGIVRGVVVMVMVMGEGSWSS